jgi:hypothetical protein
MSRISWIGTAASIIGAFTVAVKFAALGYCFFLLGSLAWTLVGIERKDQALIVLNGVFLIANLVGLYNAL